MNQLETFWLRKIIFLSMAILTLVSFMAIVRPAFAQVAPANFDEIDDYMAEEYVTANTDADYALYRFAVDLERRHRLYTACDFAKYIWS